MKPVLSIFPGLGLLDRAFEELGFCVVRGPDLIWGGDIHRFHVAPGIFQGVIGGPPCQAHSTAKDISSESGAVDLIPEYVRIVKEAVPDWLVMENVRGALGSTAVPPEWHAAVLRDWDCGGETHRVRAFWTWPFMLLDNRTSNGSPSRSVLASTAKKGGGTYAPDKRFLPGNLAIDEYERLQGYPGITKGMMDAGSSKYFAVHCLGNGVPRSLGLTVARAAQQFSESA